MLAPSFSIFISKIKNIKIEDIEILRFLEIGFDVKLVKMSNKSYPVDTKRDLYQVEKFLIKKKIDLI